MGGGIPLDIPGEGIERKFHTPAPWRGGFKGFALPPTLFRLELQVSSLDVPVGTWDVENGV